jgi:hypothetical protein
MSANSGAVTPIQIDDAEFLVATTIERCPKTMMIRELMMNAIEAASLAPEGMRRVEIRAKEFNGVSKLAIWNTGPGMDAQQLYGMCDLAASIGKQKSLDANFGMGAKVASLPSNRYGLRYRSCKDGRVNQVTMGEREGIYGRLKVQIGDDYTDTLDVTETAKNEGYPLDRDWTEVTLLGNSPDQDTVRDPYNGDPRSDVHWLATYLYHRFYRIEHGVKVVFYSNTHKLGTGTRNFEPITGRLAVFDRNETVTTPNGIKIHYIYDGQYGETGHNKSISGAIQSDVSTCGIVYKNELYDLKIKRNWTLDAPLFGIAFGARHISVHVELPDDYAVRPEAYRQFLRHNGGEQDQVEVTEYAALVAQNRPDWLIDLIRSHAPSAQTDDEVSNELQKLLDELRVKRVSPRLVSVGGDHAEPGNGVGAVNTTPKSGGGGGPSSPSTPHKHVDLNAAPEGAKPAEVWPNREKAPEIKKLYTDEEIEEKQLRGRAARYYESGLLFVNMKYPSVALMREELEREYGSAQEVESMRAMALTLSERTMIIRVGRAVVYALAKQLSKEWDQAAMRQAMAPESLSLAADDYADALQSARRKLGKTFRVSKNDSVDAAVA